MNISNYRYRLRENIILKILCAGKSLYIHLNWQPNLFYQCFVHVSIQTMRMTLYNVDSPHAALNVIALIIRYATCCVSCQAKTGFELWNCNNIFMICDFNSSHKQHMQFMRYPLKSKKLLKNHARCNLCNICGRTYVIRATLIIVDPSYPHSLSHLST